MTDWHAALASAADRAGRPLESLARRHALDGLLRRLAHSPHADQFLLRGGLLARAWLGASRRDTEDADFLALFAPGEADGQARLAAALAAPLPADDGVAFRLDTLSGRAIWEETPWPGLRLTLLARAAGAEHALQIDVGFGDPVVPAPEWLDVPCLLPGPPARLLACRPETLVGWKLHGLFEHGLRRWRAKDVYDLWLLTGSLALDAGDLAGAVRVAFTSRQLSVDVIPPALYDLAWWSAPRQRQRWQAFREAGPTAPRREAPADLPAALAEVAARLRPALQILGLELPT